ncbi:MAG: prepilin-type N-terminal cleavage/methylation domain-containing protein [Planctomycetota bacterium]
MRNRDQRSQRGFTLIEIMVVVVIIGLLMTLVGPKVWALLFQARKDIAYAKCEDYYNLLKTWKLLSKVKQNPSDLSVLTEPLGEDGDPLGEIVPDPWGGEYFIDSQGRRFRVVCPGPDGIEGTDDDISYPKRADE